MDCSPPGSSVHGIFQWEYWNGLPFSSPGDFLDPGIGIEPMSPALTGGFFATWATWEAHKLVIYLKYVPEIQCLNKIILLMSWPKFPLFSTLEMKEFVLLLSAFPQLFTITLEKEMATYSSILAWRIPWAEEPGGLQSMGCKESGTTEWLHFHFHFETPIAGLETFSFVSFLHSFFLF